MTVTVNCADCGHTAELQAAADVWKCNCAASTGDCGCDQLNESFGAEDNDNTQDLADQEAAAIEARLHELRGDAAPKGDPNV